jgi:AraC family transcriptional activator of pobA
MLNVQFEYFNHYSLTSSRYVQEHNHNCYELAYYYDGSGETSAEKSIYKYHPYTYAIYRPYVMHTEIHYDTTSVFDIGFTIDSNCPFQLETGLYDDSEKSIWNIIKKIRSEMSLKKGFYNVAVELHTAQLLLAHHRGYGREGNCFNPMYYIYKYIDENFIQDIDIQTLAEMSGYSYDYFRHLFREEAGVSPKNYIIDKRICLAKKLLLEMNISILEIAQKCGFSNGSQFTVIFKDRTGISPLQYRKSFKMKA